MIMNHDIYIAGAWHRVVMVKVVVPAHVESLACFVSTIRGSVGDNSPGGVIKRRDEAG